MQRIRAQMRGPQRAEPASAAPVIAEGDAATSILQRLRERSQAPQAGQPGPEHLPDAKPKFHELSQLRIEAGTALEGNRETGQLNPRNPGLVSSLIQLQKKVMKRSLTWYTRPIHVFQGAVIRALQQIIAILDNHRDQMLGLAHISNLQNHAIEQNRQALANAGNQFSQRVDAFEAKLHDLKSNIEVSQAQQIEALKAEVQSLHHELQSLHHYSQSLQQEMQSLSVQSRQAASQQRLRERDVRRFIHAMEQGGVRPAASPAGEVPPMFPSEMKDESQFDYFAFEDRYRGDEGVIRERQQTYLEYFRGRENVVDIGCGRGEFLEVLRDNGISARGVELGTDQYLICKDKGLEVVQQDLFSFLESTPDESLGGIFSAQVIEHMTASDQLRYVGLAYRKTKPGSPVIFETINPECVFALVRNFMLDPTHVRPVHPETLQFAMESANFRNVELRFSGPATPQQIPPLVVEGAQQHLQGFNAGIKRLNEFLYGYQDYAAIGWK